MEYPSHACLTRFGFDAKRALPTRVSKACHRCRKQKIRCDNYRPCFKCAETNNICSPGARSEPSNKRAKTRKDSNDSISRQSRQGNDSDHSSGSHDASSHHFALEESGRRSVIDDEPMHMISPSSQPFPNVDCMEAQSAMGITRKIFGFRGLDVAERSASAIPDGKIYEEAPTTNHRTTNRCPVSSILGCEIPSTEVMDVLLEEYFDSVHWFSLIIFEPKFRPEYESVKDGFADPSQKGFLILLATVLGVAAWYRSKKTGTETTIPQQDWNAWRVTLLERVGALFLELIEESSLTSIQTCLLLGSYQIYHGRPNSSFALLGATIKTAQAMGLHREPAHGCFDDIETRKRIWWTVYTWDRFASITYGRPLGINESDCNVTMPADVYERVRPHHDGGGDDGSTICFSAYQRQLNMLYMIASPVIEMIFGMRNPGSGQQNPSTRYTALMHEISERLAHWWKKVPAHLSFNFDCDIPANAPLSSRSHQLQALALQLTHDNILIILYRPIFARDVENLRRPPLGGLQDMHHPWSGPIGLPSPGTPDAEHNPMNSISAGPNLEEWWRSAERISQITKLPGTAQLATDSHLVAFLAIILFNSSIAMAVCALSDPLSDRAQGAKRNITLILRLMEFISQRSTLSGQCSVILQDVIKLLLDRESEAILAHSSMNRGHNPEQPYANIPQASSSITTVEQALRHPLPITNGSAQTQESNFDLGVDYDYCDNALRMNESLATVQKAFPAFAFENPQAQNESDNRNATTMAADGQPSPGFYQKGFNGHSGDGFQDQPAVDPGLYWLWDTLDGCPSVFE